MSVLVVMNGLPGTGKSTLSRLLAVQMPAIWLRVDTIEQALMQGGVKDIAELGYRVCYAMASQTLALGQNAVADMVNPIELTRKGWEETARITGAHLFSVECFCSDVDEHRRRVEQRAADIPGHLLPTWEEVLGREYEPHTAANLRVDTAKAAPQQLAAMILAELQRTSAGA